MFSAAKQPQWLPRLKKKRVLMLLLALNRTMLGLAGQMRFIHIGLLLSLPCAPVWVLCFFCSELCQHFINPDGLFGKRQAYLVVVHFNIGTHNRS